MKLEQVRNVKPGVVEVVFGDGANHAAKTLRSDSMAVGEHEPTANLRLQLIMLAREALRDIAYLKYGKEWREHTEWGRFWSTELDGIERGILQSAAAERPDLFGEPA